MRKSENRNERKKNWGKESQEKLVKKRQYVKNENEMNKQMNE